MTAQEHIDKANAIYDFVLKYPEYFPNFYDLPYKESREFFKVGETKFIFRINYDCFSLPPTYFLSNQVDFFRKSLNEVFNDLPAELQKIFIFHLDLFI